MTPAQKAKRKYYLANKGKCLERAKVWRLKNPDKARANTLKSSQTKPGKLRMEEYYEANKDAIRLYKQKNYQANKAKYIAKSRAWHLANPDAVKASQAKYLKSEKGTQWRRSYTPPVNCIVAKRARTLICSSFEAKGVKKNTRTETLLGCTIAFFRRHIEAQFKPGMAWDNKGLWHIDHIKPCKLFNLLDLDQQKLCFNFANLQPLWAVDNLRKGATYG